MDLNERAILEDFYNSLIDRGSLVWNLQSDLCEQGAVICTDSSPQSVTQMCVFYCSFPKKNLISIIFFFKKKLK